MPAHRRGAASADVSSSGMEAMPARFSDHHFRISSIHGDSRYHRVLTIHDVSASAWFAHAVFAAEEADTDPLTDVPSGHATA